MLSCFFFPSSCSPFVGRSFYWSENNSWMYVPKYRNYYQHKYTRVNRKSLSFIFILSTQNFLLYNRQKIKILFVCSTLQKSLARRAWKFRIVLFVLHFVIILRQDLHTYLRALFYLWHHRCHRWKLNAEFHSFNSVRRRLNIQWNVNINKQFNGMKIETQ